MRKVQKASGVRFLRDIQFREMRLDCGKSSQGCSTNGRKNGASSLIVGNTEVGVRVANLSFSTNGLPSSDLGLSGETTICPYKLAVNPSAV